MKQVCLGVFLLGSVFAVSAETSVSEIETLRREAMNGDVDAAFRLGEVYEYGDGVQSDRMLAVCYYLTAAQNGNEQAMARVRALNYQHLLPDGEAPILRNYVADLGNGVKMEFSPIPGGTFQWAKVARSSKNRNTYVTISPFALGKTEVTQAQYRAVMGKNPSVFRGDSLPVEQLSWVDAIRFCKKLTEREQRAGHIGNDCRFTLPSEAQWEYACRAGTTGEFIESDSADTLPEIAWYEENSAGWLSSASTHEVAGKKPNAWGLYDMLGNVWEWCLDYHYSWQTAGKDPVRLKPGKGARGSYRVIRGGAWKNPANSCRVSNRSCESPIRNLSVLGFRVALVQDQKLVLDLGNSVKMELLPILEGSFQMGSLPVEPERGGNEDQVQVALSGFLIGETEVTQAQYFAVTGKNPSFIQRDDFPVARVSWYDAMEFCEKLTERERKKGNISEKSKFSLPTEAQWEYACRSGTRTRFFSGASGTDLSLAAWWSQNAQNTPKPVAQKAPNTWGLYDMHGNAAEWCLDAYRPKLLGGKDPVQTEGSDRVVRGGAWYSPAKDCRSAARTSLLPATMTPGIGFRIVLVEE